MFTGGFTDKTAETMLARTFKINGTVSDGVRWFLTI
jgi:hypothetical protein